MPVGSCVLNRIRTKKCRLLWRLNREPVKTLTARTRTNNKLKLTYDAEPRIPAWAALMQSVSPLLPICKRLTYNRE